MRFKSFATVLLVTPLLIACVYPKAVKNDLTVCELVTKELTLDVTEGIGGNCFSKEQCIAAAIIGVTSVAVSGSIVVVNNTIHWLEKRGRCKRESLDANLESLSSLSRLAE